MRNQLKSEERRRLPMTMTIRHDVQNRLREYSKRANEPLSHVAERAIMTYLAQAQAEAEEVK